jgi:DNA replicative helicase MCM subunit Mcm2 (Cdc46/Mcm family)
MHLTPRIMRVTTAAQEKPDDIPEGETPHSVCMYVFDANVDVCRPGDRVTITGTYRAAVCVVCSL